MTKGADKGIYSDEVILYDENGDIYKDDNPVPVSVKDSALPDGGSTSALQILANVLLTAIAGSVAAAAATLLLMWAIQTDGTQRTQITDGTNVVQVVDYESDKSLKVAISHKPVFGAHLSVDAASGTTGFMLIDLSDTTDWPHTNTGHIVIEQVTVQTSQTTSPAFTGDLMFGFLSNVDATNGDFNQFGVMHGDRATPIGSGVFDFSTFGMDLESSEWILPITANDVLWQTDVNLLGPDGATTHPSGDGDFVLWLVSPAGTIDIGITVLYTTEN